MALPRWVTKAVRWTAFAALALVVTVVAALGLLHTRPGLEFAAERLSGALSGGGTEIRIEGLTGFIGSSLEVEKITVADSEGVYAEVADLRLAWSPAALFSGTLAVDALTAKRIALQRLPATEGESEASSGVPALPLGIRAERIAVEDIAIGEPVLGAAQRLTARGALVVEPDFSRAGVELALRRTDGTPDKAEIKISYAAAPASFTARIAIDEPRGGLLARLAGLPQGTPLSVTLKGDGPPEAWKGQLDAKAGENLGASSAVDISLADKTLTLGIDGQMRIAPLLPADLRPLVAPQLALQGTLAFTPGRDIKVSGLAARSEAATLSGAGSYTFNGGGVGGKFSLETTDKALAGLIPDLAVERAAADLTVTGTAAAPSVQLALRTGPLAYGPARAASGTADIALKSPTAGRFDIDGNLKLTEFGAGDSVPEGLLGGTLVLKAQGTVTENGALERTSITALSGPTRLEITGALGDDGAAQGSYSLKIDDIRPLARVSGIDGTGSLNGRLGAEGAFRAALGPGTAQTTLEARLEDLTGGPPWVADLIGNRLPATATLDWQTGQPLGLSGVELKPAVGTLEAEGEIDLERNTLTLETKAGISTLKRLSKLAGSDLAGSAHLTASVTGPFERLLARGQLRIRNLAVDGTRFGSLGAGYSARLAEAGPAIDLRLKGSLLAKPLDGGLKVRFPADRIDLNDIDLTLAGNRVTGKLGFVPEGSRLSGALEADIKDISALPGGDGLGIAGGLEAKITLQPEDKGTITAKVTTRRLTGAKGEALPLRIGRANANLQLADPFGNREISGDVTLLGSLPQNTQPGQAKLSFTGTLQKLDFQVEVENPRPYPAKVNATGSVALNETETVLALEELKGSYEGQPIALQSPTTARFGSNGWRAGPLDLSLAGGRLTGRAALADGRLEAEGKLEAFPLKLAALIDERAAIAGTASGTFRADGTMTAPRVAATLEAQGIRPLDSDPRNTPTLTASLKLEQDANTSRAQMSIKGPEGFDVAARVQAGPLIGGAAAGGTTPLDGTVDARIRLDLIAKLASLGGDRIGGDLRANVKLSGTLAAPRAQGEARIDGGSYEGAVTGTILRDVTARATFDGNQIRLVSLSAQDGEQGRITGEGRLRLAGDSGPEGNLTLTLNKFTALRHRIAELQASGAVKVEGSMAEPKVKGELTIDRGEIRIPDKLRQNVVELDVVEINGPPRPGMAEAPKEEELSASEALAVALDLTITVPGKTFVRGRGLNSEWKGRMEISGTTAEPVIKGKLEVVRGTFAFAGKTFRVTSGSVAFPPGAQPGAGPEISAVAEAKLTDITARIEISGSVSQPSFTVSSDPPQPQEDVLAQILFGKTSGQLTALQAAQLVQTAATLSGKAGGPGIVDKVRSAIGVDVLSVESGDGEGSGASLKAGNYLTEDVFLSVTQGTQPGSQKVGVEVEVTPNVTVESNVSGEADSNIGVNWKWDY